jgi:hypothetical protein
VLVIPVIFVLLSAGLLVTGWYGQRLNTDRDGIAHLEEEERNRRRALLCGGSAAALPAERSCYCSRCWSRLKYLQSWLGRADLLTTTAVSHLALSGPVQSSRGAEASASRWRKRQAHRRRLISAPRGHARLQHTRGNRDRQSATVVVTGVLSKHRP